MATNNYNLPQVNDKQKLGLVDATNALAYSTDAALYDIRDEFRHLEDAYTLPAATKDSLGGIRVGSGLKVYNDGTLELESTEYKLKAAGRNRLGGVYVGQNLTVTDSGELTLDEGAIAYDDIERQHFAAGSVTDRAILNNSLQTADVNQTLYNDILGVPQLWGNAKIYHFSPSDSSGSAVAAPARGDYIGKAPFATMIKITDTSVIWIVWGGATGTTGAVTTSTAASTAFSAMSCALGKLSDVSQEYQIATETYHDVGAGVIPGDVSITVPFVGFDAQSKPAIAGTGLYEIKSDGTVRKNYYSQTSGLSSVKAQPSITFVDYTR